MDLKAAYYPFYHGTLLNISRFHDLSDGTFLRSLIDLTRPLGDKEKCDLSSRDLPS